MIKLLWKRLFGKADAPQIHGDSPSDIAYMDEMVRSRVQIQAARMIVRCQEHMAASSALAPSADATLPVAAAAPHVRQLKRPYRQLAGDAYTEAYRGLVRGAPVGRTNGIMFLGEPLEADSTLMTPDEGDRDLRLAARKYELQDKACGSKKSVAE